MREVAAGKITSHKLILEPLIHQALEDREVRDRKCSSAQDSRD
jgi:hypothetical protein